MSSTSPVLSEQMRQRAIGNFRERLGTAPRRVANDQLPAGAPMMYYCRACGWLCDILPEHWFLGSPRRLCTECYAMHLKGWLSAVVAELSSLAPPQDPVLNAASGSTDAE